MEWWFGGAAMVTFLFGLICLAYDAMGNSSVAPLDSQWPAPEPDRTYRALGWTLVLIAIILGAIAGYIAFL